MTPAEQPGQRLDKWLWQARFFKSRSLAARHCADGRIRVDGETIRKAAGTVRVGQVLTFPQGARIRVVRVTGLPVRRGPAPEAAAHYEDLSPPPPARDRGVGAAWLGPRREPGAGRPTKAERRALDKLMGQGP